MVETQGTNEVYRRCQFGESRMADSLQDYLWSSLRLSRLLRRSLLYKAVCTIDHLCPTWMCVRLGWVIFFKYRFWFTRSEVEPEILHFWHNLEVVLCRSAHLILHSKAVDCSRTCSRWGWATHTPFTCLQGTNIALGMLRALDRTAFWIEDTWPNVLSYIVVYEDYSPLGPVFIQYSHAQPLFTSTNLEKHKNICRPYLFMFIWLHT